MKKSVKPTKGKERKKKSTWGVGGGDCIKRFFEHVSEEGSSPPSEPIVHGTLHKQKANHITHMHNISILRLVSVTP